MRLRAASGVRFFQRTMMIPHAVRHLRFYTMLALVLLAMLSSCLKSPTEPAVQEPASITLSSYSLVLTSIGQRVLINATVLDQDSRVISDATIFFKTGNTDIARVSDTGLVTAVSMGSTQITVTSGYATASATVTVMQEAGSITITPPSATLTTVGETVQLTAEVKDSGGWKIPGAAVVWSSSDPQYATVDANGLVTAVSIGTTRITATSAGVSQSSTVYVEIPKPAARIELNISQATLTSVGQSLKLDALVYDIDGTAIPDAPVAWSSSHPEVAAVDTTGLVSAVANGTTLVTATSGIVFTVATINVFIEQEAASITVTPESATLTSVGETVQLEAVVYDIDGVDINGAPVIWSSSDPAVATADGDGLVSAVSNGTAQITATSIGVSAFATISVIIEQVAASITIIPESATLTAVGQAVQLEAVVYTIDGVAIDGVPVVWSSSDPAVATADGDGLVSAVSNGTSQITATSGGVSTFATINVEIEELPPPPPPPEPSADREVLIAFYHATDGPNWTNNTNWLSDEPLGEWYGVTMDADGRVTNLRLRENNLSGSIPPELGGLSELTELDLHPNNLTGGIPVELGQLSNLNLLWLSHNSLTGGIPVELGQLGNLVELNLDNNQLTGTIPSELARLSDLHTLNLFTNQLTGGIPAELGQLSDLSILSLGDNQLTGNIPLELGQLKGLTLLWVQENRLSGGISPALWQMTSLESLSIGDNQFTGDIPPELGQLVNLKLILFRQNQLSGRIPPELGQLKNLEDLVLHNNQLMGSIPSELGQLESVIRFELQNNQLTGGLPIELGDLSAMRSFILSDNPGLTGPLPSSLTNLSLNELSTANTQLCAPADATFQRWLASIPAKSDIIECSIAPEPSSDRDALIALYNATGGPNWTNQTNWVSEAPLGEWYGVETDNKVRVIALDLVENGLKGVLPPELGELENLTALQVQNNELTDAIPAEIGQLRNLTTLGLNDNLLTGPIPAEIGMLVELKLLYLRNNQLTGSHSTGVWTTVKFGIA